jgi:hypothetical protein
MTEWKQYRRKNIAEMRPVVKGEDLDGISISAPDNQLRYDNPAAFDLGFIARNPVNHSDQWYVARDYFAENFEPLWPNLPESH